MFDNRLMKAPRWPTMWGQRTSPWSPSAVVEEFRALMIGNNRCEVPKEFSKDDLDDILIECEQREKSKRRWSEEEAWPRWSVYCPADWWGVEYRAVAGRSERQQEQELQEVGVVPVEREEGAVLEVEVGGEEQVGMELEEVAVLPSTSGQKRQWDEKDLDMGPALKKAEEYLRSAEVPWKKGRKGRGKVDGRKGR